MRNAVFSWIVIRIRASSSLAASGAPESHGGARTMLRSGADPAVQRLRSLADIVADPAHGRRPGDASENVVPEEDAPPHPGQAMRRAAEPTPVALLIAATRCALIVLVFVYLSEQRS